MENCEWTPCCGDLGMCDSSCGQLFEIESEKGGGSITEDELRKFEGRECPDCHKKITISI